MSVLIPVKITFLLMHNEEIWKCQEIVPANMEAKWKLYYLTIE